MTIGDWKRRTNPMSWSCLNTKVAVLSDGQQTSQQSIVE